MAYSPPPGRPYYGPQGQPYPPYSAAPPTNGMAITALVCGIAAFVVGITFIPAIIFGHMAQRQIRRTGERGESLALGGLVLGYVAGALFVGLVLSFLVIAIKVGHSGSATHAVLVPFIRPGSHPGPLHHPGPIPALDRGLIAPGPVHVPTVPAMAVVRSLAPGN